MGKGPVHNPYRGKVDEQGLITTDTTPAENFADQALIAVAMRGPMTDGPELRQVFRDAHHQLLSDALRDAYNARDKQRVDELTGWVETAEQDLAWMLQARAGVFGHCWTQFYDRQAYEDEKFRQQCRRILTQGFEQAMREGDEAKMDELARYLEMNDMVLPYPPERTPTEGDDLDEEIPF